MGFRVGVPLEGDIVIALWFGTVVRDTDAPALAYAFHTAFAAPGVLRIEPRDLTVGRCIRTTCDDPTASPMGFPETGRDVAMY